MARQAEVQAVHGKLIRSSNGERSEINKVSYKSTIPVKKGITRKETSKAQGPTKQRVAGADENTQRRQNVRRKIQCAKGVEKWDTGRSCAKHAMSRCSRKKASTAAKATTMGQRFSERCINKTKKAKTSKVNIAQFEKEMDFLVDTGADISCISLKNVPDKYKSKIKQTDKLIYGASGKKLKTVGYLKVDLIKNKSKTNAKIYILNRLTKNLLGKPEIKSLNLIGKIKRIESKVNESNNVINREFSGIFNGIGKFGKELKIHIKENARPVALTIPRQLRYPYCRK